MFSRTVLASLSLPLAMLPMSRQPVVPDATPRAVCGPASLHESGAQGRVTAADLATGLGSHCNLEMLGHEGTLGGFRVHRYVDPAGHECAYYDTTPYLPLRQVSAFADPDLSGTHVLDMSDPSHPVRTADLETPAMRSPHESLSLNVRRGLLAANMGNAATSAGIVDIYDLEQDCRHPVLLSSLPVGVAGHEGSFSPDGLTYWATSPVGYFLTLAVNNPSLHFGGLTAVDVSDPANPRTLWTSPDYVTHGLNASPDGRTLYMADLGPDKGLRVLDVTEIQERRPNPRVRLLGHLGWDTVSLPQTDIPVTIGGHPYLVEVDEFASNIIRSLLDGSGSDPAAFVGAARIIDVDDPVDPRVVSDIRLEVHAPQARGGAQAADPGASRNGYAAHYCAVPRAIEPGIVACSFIASGVRVFDIHDPVHPSEIAYFNPPFGRQGAGEAHAPYDAFSAPAFVPERGEIWYTDGNYGFYVLRVTNGVWQAQPGGTVDGRFSALRR
ncbi:MAG: hypothetical protein E6I76_00640 [Chloroflexi bacterium]|nr:MAG: hypothetical protein E6I76_00640 [Chloroflexota bacterium]